MKRGQWGIYSLKTKTWVYDHDPDVPCDFPSRSAAAADLKGWCMKKALPDYEPRRMES